MSNVLGWMQELKTRILWIQSSTLLLRHGFYKDTKPFAICQNDRIVGFVSMYVGEENYQIINFMIDRAYQKKGLGTEAAQRCIAFLQQEYGATRISAPVNTENKAAHRFWKRLGFAFSDSIEDGYVF